MQLLVATTGGFVLSVLRPRYAKVVTAAVLATLFVPGIVVVLVPLFLTVLDLPLFGTSLLDTYWAVWLPAGANAFNVLLVKRFMDGLPREVFEAAQVDGAGPFRLLWYVVLPMSRPILGVVSILAMLNAWKDYLWPLIVLPNPEIQPLSVRLPHHPRHRRARRVPGRAADLDGAADRAVPGVPAPLPARRRHRRRGQGLVPSGTLAAAR